MLRMMFLSILLCPITSLACGELQSSECERIAQLVAERTQAIKASFGDLAPFMPEGIEVRLMKAKSAEGRRFSGQAGYDAQLRTLFLPQRLADQVLPAAEQARDYWPFYEDSELRETYPVVAQIDAALWDVYLQEAARGSGLSWPPADCQSPDSVRRLPCEMVASGIAEYVNRQQQRIFNANRLEQIWPENYAEFADRLWRPNDRSVTDVKRYGGLLLLQPLVRKFGVPWALAYIARTPFQVEDNNMRESAQRFQERALKSVM